MTSAERAEAVMHKHLGVVPPWDRPWKLRAFEIILENLPEITGYMASGGVPLIHEPERLKLIRAYVGENGHDKEDIGFNVWLLNQCIGERSMSPNEIFMRCTGCNKIRTSRSMANGPCKCGSNRVSTSVGPMGTKHAFWCLASGY